MNLRSLFFIFLLISLFSSCGIVDYFRVKELSNYQGQTWSSTVSSDEANSATLCNTVSLSAIKDRYLERIAANTDTIGIRNIILCRQEGAVIEVLSFCEPNQSKNIIAAFSQRKGRSIFK